MAEKTITRREARELLLGLLFESEFRTDESYIEIYAASAEERLIPEDKYIKNAYYTIFENKEAIDERIGKSANGWRADRLSKMSRSLLRLGAYEMMYEAKIPFNVTINEVIELAKAYDDPKARTFVNGVLNSMKDALEAEGVQKEDKNK